MELDTALTTTRSVRKRLDLTRPVDRAVIEECLRIAFQAPNGSNGQTWAWVVVDDPATKQQMAELYRASINEFASRPDERPRDYSTPEAQRISASVYHLSQHLQDVPALVVPVIQERFEGVNSFYQASHWGSILPAVWNFMLALRGRGLGSAWTTIHLWHEKEMAELLGIPYDDYTQAGIFPVAYTIGTDFKPADRSASDELIYWNRFGSR